MAGEDCACAAAANGDVSGRNLSAASSDETTGAIVVGVVTALQTEWLAKRVRMSLRRRRLNGKVINFWGKLINNKVASCVSHVAINDLHCPAFVKEIFIISEDGLTKFSVTKFEDTPRQNNSAKHSHAT